MTCTIFFNFFTNFLTCPSVTPASRLFKISLHPLSKLWASMFSRSIVEALECSRSAVRWEEAISLILETEEPAFWRSAMVRISSSTRDLEFWRRTDDSVNCLFLEENASCFFLRSGLCVRGVGVVREYYEM